jgi:hypothetical protein
LATGSVENSAEATSEKKYYGFPLTWRIIDTPTGALSFDPVGFLADYVFGVIVSSFMIFVATRTERWILKKNPSSTKKQIQRAERRKKKRQS